MADKFGNIHCSKCGARASTKCFHCRSVFPQNQLATSLSNMVEDVKVEDAYFGNGEQWKGMQFVKVELKLFCDVEHNEQPEDKIVKFFEHVMLNDNPKEVFCNHDWRWDKGEKSSIGCGHGYSQQQRALRQEKAIVR